MSVIFCKECSKKFCTRHEMVRLHDYPSAMIFSFGYNYMYTKRILILINFNLERFLKSFYNSVFQKWKFSIFVCEFREFGESNYYYYYSIEILWIFTSFMVHLSHNICPVVVCLDLPEKVRACLLYGLWLITTSLISTSQMLCPLHCSIWTAGQERKSLTP